jgi:redox-sensing transcriptional repressor
MPRPKTRYPNLPAVRRLPRYLGVLREMEASGREVVSSAHLARELGLEQIVVKKDLGLTGAVGKTGVGYEVPALLEAIEAFLGWNNTSEAFLVGAGDLGSALLGYEGFREHGLALVAGFDTDPEKIGAEIHGVPILAMEKLPDLAARMHVHLAVLTVPEAVAQEVTETLVAAGIRGIWNFTSGTLAVPEEVVVQREDLAASLAELSAKLKHAAAEATP